MPSSTSTASAAEIHSPGVICRRMPTLRIDDQQFDVTPEQVEEIKQLMRAAQQQGFWEWTVTDDDGDQTWMAIPTLAGRFNDW